LRHAGVLTAGLAVALVAVRNFSGLFLATYLAIFFVRRCWPCAQPRGSDFTLHPGLDLEEAVKGRTVKITIPGQSLKCEGLDGNGAEEKKKKIGSSS